MMWVGFDHSLSLDSFTPGSCTLTVAVEDVQRVFVLDLSCSISCGTDGRGYDIFPVVYVICYTLLWGGENLAALYHWPERDGL